MSPGRSLSASGFEADDGTADPALAAALAGFAAGGAGLAEVVVAIAGARLLVPVVAVAGDSSSDAAGSATTGATAGSSAEMAVPHLRSRDGRTALPVFSCVAALTAWDARARPVPVEARRAALSAVDDGCDLLVLDPGGAAVTVPRPAVWALAQGRDWTPSPRDPDVAAAVRDAVAVARRGHPALVAGHGGPGERSELRVVLEVETGLDAAGLRELTGAVSAALAANEVVAQRVDSLELRVMPG